MNHKDHVTMGLIGKNISVIPAFLSPSFPRG